MQKKVTAFFSALVLLFSLVGCSLTQNTSPIDVNPTTTVTLDKSEYMTGDDMFVSFDIVGELDTTAWIGVVPAGTEHSESEADLVDTTYQYISNNIGSVMLTAPSTSGDYEIRIYSSDSDVAEELGFTTFSVLGEEEVEISLAIDKTTYTPGETIVLTYIAPDSIDITAWVGIIPSEIEHGSEEINDQNDIDYEYVFGHDGTIEFTAPTTAGEYDLRLNSSDGTPDAVELYSVSFVVE